MVLQIDFTWLAGLLLSFFGAVFAFGKILLAQVEKRLDERFGAIEEKNKEASEHWRRVERDLLTLKADLPLQYVRREDYIRGQAVIEAKLDALYSKLETVQLKGARHD